MVITTALVFALLAISATSGKNISEVGESTIIASDFIANEGENIVTTIWKRNSVVIVHSVAYKPKYFDPRLVLLEDRSLQIQGLRLNDSGEYSVNIVTMDREHTRIVELTVLASPVVEVTATTVVDDESGEPKDVATCTAIGGSEPFTIEWYENDVLIANSSERIDSRNFENSDLLDSQLILSRVVEVGRDNGREFTCVVVDALGKRKEEPVSLIVNAYPMIFNFPSEKVITLTIGEKRDIICQASGVPQPKVTWMKDNEKVGSGYGEKVITVEASDYSDSGNYKCKAGNKEGDDSKTVKVVVQGKPVISGSEALVNGTEKYTMKPDDEIVALVCQAESVPTPEITWDVDGKNMEDLEANEKSDSLPNGVKSYFNISSKHFMGENPVTKITCSATNAKGMDQKIFLISVPAAQASNTGLIVAIVVVVLVVLPVTAMLIYFFVIRKRQGSMDANVENGSMFGFATCCGGSKVKSKELREDDDAMHEVSVKETKEEGTEEEKLKLKDAEEKPDSEPNEASQENQDESGDKDEEPKHKISKRKFPLPLQCCSGRKKTINKEDAEEDNGKSSESEEQKNQNGERDSGKGDTLEKVIE